MRAVEPIRRRDGAVMWGLFTDAKDSSRYLEIFMSETWGEHLRQHYRLTVSDRSRTACKIISPRSRRSYHT
jgi:transmembrane secretion effector